jgi:hypothetical protein
MMELDKARVRSLASRVVNRMGYLGRSAGNCK